MRRHDGFTLVELLVALGVIALLSALLFPVFAKVRDKGRQTICLSNERQLGMALFLYAQDDGEAGPPDFYRWAGRLFPYVKSVGVFRCPSDDTPAQPPDFPVSYGLNCNFHSFTALSAPTNTVLLFEVVHATAEIATPDEGWTPHQAAPRYVSVEGAGTGPLFANAAFLRGDIRLDADEPARYATGLMNGPTGPSSQESFYEGAGHHQGGANFLFGDDHARWLSPQQVSTGADAAAADSGPWYGTGRPFAAAGTEDAHFAATFSTR